MKLQLSFALLLLVSGFSSSRGKFNTPQEIVAHYRTTTTEADRDACKQEFNVLQTQIDHFNNQGEFTDNQNFKCYLRCLGIRSKSIDEDGQLNLEVTREQLKLSDGQVDGLRKNCLEIKNDDLCQKNIELFGCVIKTVLSTQ